MKPIAIITGASRGIGLATAELFLKKEFDVLTLSRTPCPLTAVKHYETDLSTLERQETLHGKIAADLKERNKIVLIHNAGIYLQDSTDVLPTDHLRKTFEINVIAPSILNQWVIPLMPKKSAIIYIGSTLSEQACKNGASYIASKHAILGLMRATTQDLGSKEIHAVCVCPGVTDTEMLRTNVAHNDPNTLQYLREINLFKRLITPAEIAETIYFTAMNPVMNGSVIHANLGQHAS